MYNNKFKNFFLTNGAIKWQRIYFELLCMKNLKLEVKQLKESLRKD